MKTESSRVRRLFLNNSLSLAMLGFFFVFWIGQTFTGLSVYNSERADRQQAKVSLLEYLTTGHFLEATAENWESEFLQMAAFVWMTAFLFQKGSPESNPPDGPSEEAPLTADSPWLARRGGWVRKLYGNSLSICFFSLFLVCFVLHALGGARSFSEEEVAQGRAAVSTAQYLVSSQFWFESLQNWQSEFLSIAAMVVLSIYLRQRNSPESKDINTPNAVNE